MKVIFFMGLTSLLIIHWVSPSETINHNNNTAVVTRLHPNKARFIEMMGRGLKSLWAKFTGNANKESFIGRCFGVARKLKFAMPLILFKLGVIVTILGFLTIFSLKTLGLLAFLVLMNVSGAMTKLALLFSGKHPQSKAWTPPQNVHLHVHQTKDGNIELDHAAGGWEDRLGYYGSSNEDVDNVEASNLYNNKNYLNALLLRNHEYINR